MKMVFVVLLYELIPHRANGKICLTTVGIEPTTFGHSSELFFMRSCEFLIDHTKDLECVNSEKKFHKSVLRFFKLGIFP